ncbi:hypothetical protein ACOQFV_20375 [Nocardiopsis changdeensis]|uniref:Uncharacterized protein n=1 Tax=Nocardiopsis changdeensis TaxID=2831969 RepID=A0ABX8BTH5_9ACTN|nr:MULTISPECIES: hypothetical protein [Nocardiopsis]QUX25562.1 hypothetical protein KGD84_15770 [Nocardiopsis changdeensis]QYX35948.1 hypothetical protein K1J57_25225 [Nocardiopsis sp. MT53]
MTTKAWNESGRTVHAPTPRDVDTMVAGLEAGNEFLIVERADDHYVQVLWRHREGRYQLEYRDGGPTEHHRTYTESPEEVVTAMSGWLTGAPAWREPFTWEDISHYFTGDGS